MLARRTRPRSSLNKVVESGETAAPTWQRETRAGADLALKPSEYLAHPRLLPSSGVPAAIAFLLSVPR